MFDMLLKSMGLTQDKIKEYSDGIVEGLNTLNLNVANILAKVESVETRLAAIEAAQPPKPENKEI